LLKHHLKPALDSTHVEHSAYFIFNLAHYWW